MSDSSQPIGIALICDQQGVVLKVIRNELNTGEMVKPRQLLLQMVDPGSRGKMLNFLVELKAALATFDWQINVPIAGEVTILHFGGAVMDEFLLVFASRTRNGVLELYEDLVKINNEQVNTLRASLKERTETTRIQLERDSSLYDELSRLNNELVSLQRELAKQNVELEKLNNLKNQFLGMAAHDLRTPLGHILSYSEFLIDEAGPQLSEEHLEFLNIIRASSDFMLQLVDDLLDFAKIESGKLTLNRQPTDLIALARHNIALNSVLAARKQIELQLEIKDDSLPAVMIDPARIEQVLNNMTSNAIKFSKPNGFVRVTISRDGDLAVVAVADQGTGMSPEQLEQLFNPFSKSAKGTTGEKGTGLGLAIVKKIVEEHKGAIRVESEAGRGSTFYLSLPIH